MITQIDNTPTLSAKSLKQAVKSLRPFTGDAFVSSIMRDLESHGFLPNDEKQTFSFEQINARLEYTFGEAAPLLMRIIERALFEKKAGI